MRDPLRYRVTGNDAVSDDFEIKTYFPPEVKGVKARIEPPAYTGMKAQEQNSPDIRALRASTVQVEIDPSVKLAKAKLRFSTATEPLELTQTVSGTWTGTLTVTKDTDYWIELADPQGHRGGDEKPHHIHAVPDAPAAGRAR